MDGALKYMKGVRFVPPRPHKYGAKGTVVDGILFASKKEAAYYATLKMRQDSGELRCFLRQVPVHLPGGTKLVVDFVEFWTNGDVRFVDVKGVITEGFKIKRREVEHHYPFTIEVV